MNDLRWSFNPVDGSLDVWDSEQGRTGHYERHGSRGYREHAQGRIYPGRYWTIYVNRPIAGTEAEQVAIRERAKQAVTTWAELNHQQKCVFHDTT